MEYNNDKMKKFAKKSEFESEVDSKVTAFETLTNIEAFRQGRFPDNLVEEFKTPENLPNSMLFNEIEAKHKEILEALDTRDGARLAEILKRHLRNKCETVKTALKEFEDTAKKLQKLYL